MTEWLKFILLTLCLLWVSISVGVLFLMFISMSVDSWRHKRVRRDLEYLMWLEQQWAEEALPKGVKQAEDLWGR